VPVTPATAGMEMPMDGRLAAAVEVWDGMER
jgi:hypothetical protein